MVFSQNRSDSSTGSTMVSYAPMVEMLEPRLMLSAPTLSIPGPGDNHFVTQGDSLTVVYTATAGSSATVTFSVNVTNSVLSTATAIPVATNQPLGANVILSIDTSGLLPGRYYLHGSVTDSDGVTTSAVWNDILIVAPADNAAFSYVRIDTSLGMIVLELDRATAPITVANFLNYINTGFYGDTIFHRVSTTGNLIQMGAYTAEYEFKLPYSSMTNENLALGNDSLPNLRGTIAMAYEITSNTRYNAQFFINTADNPGYDYVEGFQLSNCVFGRVIIGMDVVDAIAALATTTVVAQNGATLPNAPITPVTVLSTVADKAVARVLHNGQSVASGRTLPNGAPNPIDWSGAGTDMVFTLRNDGAVAMDVGTVVLNEAIGFFVKTQPGVAVLQPGESTTFTISRTSMDDEGRYAEVSFATNGTASGAYSFAITTNRQPTAEPQDLRMTNNGVVVGVLVGHDAETPDHELTYIVLSQPMHGYVEIVGNMFYYTIDSTYNGADSFTFGVIDTGFGASPPRMSEPTTITLSGGFRAEFDAKGVYLFDEPTATKPNTGKITLQNGTGSLFINDDGSIGRIFITSSNDKTNLNISTSMKAGVTVYGIESTGPIASIKGNTVDLRGFDSAEAKAMFDDFVALSASLGIDAYDLIKGTVVIGASTNPKTTVSMTFLNVTDAIIVSAMPVKEIKTEAAATFASSLTLFAPSIDTLSIKGSLQLLAKVTGNFGSIKANDLKNSTLTVGGTFKGFSFKGDVLNSTFIVTGEVNELSAGNWRDNTVTLGGVLKKLNVKGDVSNSTFTVAGDVNELNAGNWFNSDITLSKALKKLNVKGTVENSVIYVVGGITDQLSANEWRNSPVTTGGMLKKVNVKGTVSDSPFVVAGDVNELSAGNWLRSNITFSKILKKLNVKGTLEDSVIYVVGNIDELAANEWRNSPVTADGLLKKLNVKGTVSDSPVVVAGDVNELNAGHWLRSNITLSKTLKKLNVKGTVEDTTLYVVGGITDQLSANEWRNSPVTTDGMLKKVNVKGTVSDSPFIVAGDVNELSAGNWLRSNITFSKILKKLNVKGTVADSTFTVASDANELNAGAWVNSPVNLGGAIKKLNVKGDVSGSTFTVAGDVGQLAAANWLGSNITLSKTLNNLNVKGAVANSTIHITGDINQLSAGEWRNSPLTASGAVKTFAVKETVLDTNVNITGDVGQLSANNWHTSPVSIGGTLKTFALKGTIADSNVNVAGAVEQLSAGEWSNSHVDLSQTLKTFAVKGVMVNSTVNVTGNVGQLSADEWRNSNVTLGGALTNFAVKGEMLNTKLVADGVVGTIKAASLKDVGLDLRDALANLTVTDWVDDSTVVAKNIATVNIGGARRTHFGAGVDYTLLTTRNVEQGDPLPTGMITSFTVSGVSRHVGDSFVDSSISAGVGTVAITNWDGLRGLYAPNDKIGTGSGTPVTLKFTTTPAPFTADDFIHRLF